MQDTISRQAAIQEVLEWQKYMNPEGMADRIRNLPSAQPDRDAVTMMEDGTLSVTADVDITRVKRILLTQRGTQNGGLYYRE